MAVFPSDSIRTKNWGTEILTDSDLEAQFDLLHAYFTACLNASTGHTHDGTSNQGPKLTTLGTVACTLPINFAKGSNIASATTTDIGAATGNCVDVTGTTTITGLGTVQAGTVRFVRFTGALTLTYNGTSLILPNGTSNITTAAGDTAIFESLGSGNWVCLHYQRKDGTAVSSGNFATQADQETATSTVLAVTPGRQQYHPSAAKWWCRFNGETAGTNAPTSGYNVTSVTRTGTGAYTINLTTAFSGSNTSCLMGSVSDAGAAVNAIVNPITLGTTTCTVIVSSGGAAADYDLVCLVGFGDQ